MGYKSRKALFNTLIELKEHKDIKVKLPNTYKEMLNEIFGKAAYIFITFESYKERRRVELLLIRHGFKVNETYWPGSPISSVRVSYFKGWHWNE